jgi:Na+-driven multidrug efflux pump
VSVLLALLIFGLGSNLGYIFSSHPDIVKRTSNLAPLASLFCIPYGLQITLKGILRAINCQGDLIW